METLEQGKTDSSASLKLCSQGLNRTRVRKQLLLREAGKQP